MSQDRDPRINPIPGDIVRNPGHFPFKVMAVESDGSVSGNIPAGREKMSLGSLRYWRENYALDAEIVKRGDADAN